MALSNAMQEAHLLRDSETDSKTAIGNHSRRYSELEGSHFCHAEKRLRVFRRIAIVQFVFLVASALIMITWSWQEPQSRSLVYSPAQGHVRYRTQRYDAELVIASDYVGDPSPTIDAAWAKLLQRMYMNIGVPKADIDRVGLESIGVPGEPGIYLAGMSVYHELHCLKRLRQYTYLDYYFPNVTAAEARMNRLHTDHCIDLLRQAIMCHADVSLFTLEWPQDSTMPRANFTNEHQCVDWEFLDTWASPRSVSEEKMLKLQHPIRGPAFPDGKGSLIGGTNDHSPAIHEHAS